jgi:hypothetical protein
MIRSRTLFVVGAGASKEVRLPTGDELKKTIAQKLDTAPARLAMSDDVIRAALLFHVGRRASGDDFREYLVAAKRMSAAMPLSISIDNYMEAHRGDERVQTCGKLAIVRSILQAERSSTLAADALSSPIDFAPLESTWFVRFIRMLAEACEVPKVDSLFDNVTMVNFNYDRCVEHFLEQALQAYFGLGEERAKACVARMTCHHPYGTVAPWREGSEHLGFGEGARIDSQEHLLRLSARIRTYSEEATEGGDFAAIKQAVRDADVIVFLGFAYHPLNMELLRPADGASKLRRAYGTVYGMSESDTEAVRMQIRSLAPESYVGKDQTGRATKLLNGTCDGLFKEYSRALSQR